MLKVNEAIVHMLIAAHNDGKYRQCANHVDSVFSWADHPLGWDYWNNVSNAFVAGQPHNQAIRMLKKLVEKSGTPFDFNPKNVVLPFRLRNFG